MIGIGIERERLAGKVTSIALGILLIASTFAIMNPVQPANAQSTTVIIPYLATGYKFKVVGHGGDPGFEQPSFSDSTFSTGNAGFGSGGFCPLDSTANTFWPLNTDILLRKQFNLPAGTTNLKVGVAIDNDVQVFINGVDISGGIRFHEGCASRDSFVFTAPDSILNAGSNLLAVRAIDRGVVSYVDVQVTATVPPSPASPPFSQPINSIFPNAQQSITCLQGHFDPSVPKHFWFYQSKVNGSATIDVRAAAVNAAETGSVIAKLFDGATQIGSVTVPHPPTGENTGSITIPSAVAGTIYRLEVELGAPAPNTPQAHHYKVTSSDSLFSVGVNSPTHRYSEHFGTGEPEVFHANVGAGENFVLDIFTEFPDFGAPQATSVKVTIRDRSNLATLFGPTTFTLGSAPASQVITLTNPFPSSAGQLVLYIEADGHYRMDKTSGTDRGIYYDTCPPAPQLTVIKEVTNDNGGQAAPADFSITVNGNNPLPNNFPGSPTGTVVTLKAGLYSVTETGPNGYSSTFSDDCEGSIEAGEEKTCTITNDDIAPQLIVIKNVINDNGGTATPSQFTITVNGNNPSPASFPGLSAGTTVTLNAGSYTVTETGPNGYLSTFSADCTGSIAVGEVKTCTITNNDIAPARTIGYWKNHEDHVAAILAEGPINLGDTTVVTVNDAKTVLSNTNNKDARNQLRAQLLATILNLRNDSDPLATGSDIGPVVDGAINFLATHPSPVTGKHPDRGTAISLKDKLDAYNNSGEG
jgi:hypothetical protein